MKDSATQLLKAKLQEAMRCLEAYSKEMLKKRGVSRLQKTVSLFKSLVFDKKREHIEILQAIELISRQRLFIQKLKDGTPEEKKLANSLTKIIEAYNDTQQSQEKNKTHHENKVSKFFQKFESFSFSEFPKIDLPQEKSITFNSPGILLSRLNKPSSSIQLSKQTTELFQMKALALLERYGIATNPEARGLVKNSPIIATIESGTSKCILTQQLLLFPGQTVVVMGSSELDSKTQSIHRLFPETFYISLESTQTGFPDPSQRSGWALANQLIPDSPQRPDLLDSLSEFFERKKALTVDLLPHGKLFDKAKHFLRIKKALFDANSRELIELHRELALTLVQVSQFLSKENIDCEIVNSFFDYLQKCSQPMDELISAHQKVRGVLISKPHKVLLETIITESVESSYDVARAVLEKALEGNYLDLFNSEEPDSKYIAILGSILGKATNQIILQYLSEDLLFLPPILNAFEQKIQALAYRQAEDFINELHAEDFDADEMYQKVKGDIESDIALLKMNAFLVIPEKLAAYYQMRHESL